LRKSSAEKARSPLKVSPSKERNDKKVDLERVLTRHGQKSALILKKKITKDINGKIISRTRLNLGKKSLKFMKKKPIKAENDFYTGKNCKANGIPQGLGPNMDQNCMRDMPQGSYYQPHMDMNNGHNYNYQGSNHYDMDSN